jgi:hypothetical protein
MGKNTLYEEADWTPSLSQSLIEDNIRDGQSRNLLVSTDCFGKTIAYIQRICKKHGREV